MTRAGSERWSDVVLEHRLRQFVILIVEDSESISELLVDALNDDSQYEAVAVSNPLVALHRVPVLHPDLLIIDVGLPEMSGLEFYDWVRQLPGTGRVPALFITANLQAVPRVRARGLPVLTKPFDVDDFLEKVAALLGTSS